MRDRSTENHGLLTDGLLLAFVFRRIYGCPCHIGASLVNKFFHSRVEKVCDCDAQALGVCHYQVVIFLTNALR